MHFHSKSLSLVHLENVQISLTSPLAGDNGWCFPYTFLCILGFSTIRDSPLKNQKIIGIKGCLELHSICVSILKQKTELWFPCLGVYLPSKYGVVWVPDLVQRSFEDEPGHMRWLCMSPLETHWGREAYLTGWLMEVSIMVKWSEPALKHTF